MRIKMKRLSDEERDRLASEYEMARRQRDDVSRRKYWRERTEQQGTATERAALEGEDAR